MTEQEAISAITIWARQHFSEGDARLEVSVMHIEFDLKADEWEATLQVSTSAINPTVRFFANDTGGIQVMSVGE